MKQKLFGFLLLLGLISLPASGQTFDLLARAVWIDSTGDSLDFGNDDDFGVEFDDEVGFGLAVNAFLTNRWSVEAGASLIEPDFVLVIDTPEGPRGTEGLEMIPVTAALQFHFLGSGRFDPYVGAGATYITFDEVSEIADLTDSDVESIELDDDLGWMVNAGLNIRLFRSFGFNVDAKYSEVEPETAVTFRRGDFTAVRDVEFNPLLVSAGLSWRF